MSENTPEPAQEAGKKPRKRAQSKKAQAIALLAQEVAKDLVVQAQAQEPHPFEGSPQEVPPVPENITVVSDNIPSPVPEVVSEIKLPLAEGDIKLPCPACHATGFKTVKDRITGADRKVGICFRCKGEAFQGKGCILRNRLYDSRRAVGARVDWQVMIMTNHRQGEKDIQKALPVGFNDKTEVFRRTPEGIEQVYPRHLREGDEIFIETLINKEEVSGEILTATVAEVISKNQKTLIPA